MGTCRLRANLANGNKTESTTHSLYYNNYNIKQPKIVKNYIPQNCSLKEDDESLCGFSTPQRANSLTQLHAVFRR